MVFTYFLIAPVHAEVVTDGTLGNRVDLPGPNFQIDAKLGQQHGGNLFHSFQDFNLQSQESATFSGPNTVQNIISRVTGGNPSRIDGTLRSTIPNADLYFLNPYGIMFGPNARLDVQGGFHASTAHYLRLQDGGRFEARYPNNSLLTVAPVVAFGFLTDTPASIKTQDSQLAVSKGKTFSLIGGGLEFQGSIPPDYDYGTEILISHGNSWLLANVGRLNLASVASRGEVIPTAAGLDLTATGGSIRATNTELGVSDEEGGGNIFIRGGRFEMTRSLVNSQTVNQDGGMIDIQVTNLTLQDRTVIETSTFGTAPGGPLNLQVTEELSLTNSDIWSDSHGTMPQAGNAGNVEVQAHRVNLADGSQISSSTLGTGQGGTVHLEVTETLTATGTNAEGYTGSVVAGSYNEELANAGNAGDIFIQTRQVNLAEGGGIFSGTFGTGQGGIVHLQVAETLTATGEIAVGIPSSVVAGSYNKELVNAGNAGDIFIQARNINLVDGAQIASNTLGTGQGGTVHLQVAETLTVTGGNVAGGYSSAVSTDSENEELANAGNAGDIIIQARDISLVDGAQIASNTSGTGQGGIVHLQVAETLTATGEIAVGVPSSVVAGSYNKELANAGNAGDIIIQARDISLVDGAQIASSTFGTGQGGTVHLQVAETLMVSGQNIDDVYPSGVFASSQNNQLENAGAAGKIGIEARQVVVCKGIISNNTFGTGQGGPIDLQVSETLTVSDGSIGAGSLDFDGRYGDSDFLKEGLNAGPAGSLSIRANTINLLNRGVISTQQGRNSGSGGGNITLTSPNLLYLQNGQITTSVKGGIGNGGNINIDHPQFVVLNQGQIRAQADEGHGGNIRIVAEQFIPSADSLISASSQKGISGDVIINSPENNISNSLVILGTMPLKAETSGTLCNKRYRSEKPSRFVVTPLAGYLPSPDDDWQSSSFKK